MNRKLKNTAVNAAFTVAKKAFDKPPKMAAVIAAGGTSSRMGGINKLFADICDTPVLAMTLNAFDMSDEVSEIVISANANDIECVNELIEAYAFKKVTAVVAGGNSRAESVYNGVKAVSDSCVLIAIHDGARPFITENIIKATYDAACRYGAAAPCVPVKDTIKIAKNTFVGSTPDRSELFAIQTPQTFDASLIKAALFNAIENDLPITDDCSAVEAVGGKIKLTDGSYDNIKITTPDDLIVGEAIYKARVKL